MTSFYIVTYIDVQPSSTSQGIDLISQYCEGSSTDSENLGIDLVQETGRQNRFVMVEVWKDESCFRAHEQTQRAEQFRARFKAIHNSPSDQRVHHAFTIGPAPAARKRDTLCLVTHVDVPPPRKSEAETLLKSLAEESRRDPGNVRYDVFQQIDRPNHFTVFAEWKDQAAFDSHEMKPHRRSFRETLWPMLGSPYDERLYKPLRL
jgi:quinol monooxygenase YgiN